MGMVVRTNTMAINAYRQLGMNNSAVAKSLEKLASGYRINRAGDDAAGLAISEKMKAQITGLETASANAQDGISLIQTAEGNLNEVHDMLNRMVELATKSANGTYTKQERSALQSEVDQLLDEIDRISKSANFNGTKLLNGTMGLNQDAFKSFEALGSVAANDGALKIADFVAKEADGSPKVHMEEASVTAATPTAKIDLGDLTIKDVAAGATAAVTFSIAGKDYAVTVTNTGAAAADIGVTDIAAALIAKLNGDVNSTDGTTTTGKDAMQIGDAAFKATNNGGVITLTYAGTKTDGTTYKAETTFSGNQAAADKINTGLGFDVTVDVGSNTKTGDVIHKATNVDQARAKKDASKAGIDINLTDLVKDGNTLTIDGKTFIFKVGADSEIEDAGVAAGGAATGLDAAGNAIIDVSTAKEGEEVHRAADLLSKQTITGQDSRSWKIGVNGNGTTIHIDQTVASAANKELKTYEDLVGVISAKGTPTEAKGAGTKVTVQNSELVAGDSIKIGSTVYTFVDKAPAADDANKATKIVLGSDGKTTLDNLKQVVEANDTKLKIEVASDGTNFTVRQADATSKVSPSVVGPGLTLQIGDTADEFNKMTVDVDNMSADGLSIGSLKNSGIMTEAKASNAIDMIKNAINTVSETRAKFGALQNRLEHTINNLDVAAENLSAANSRIRDTDMAKEMMNYTKMNVLVQSAQAMLAQANQQPQSVLQLLQ